MTITIPPELVPLLRDGLYFDLHGQLDEAGALIEPRDRGDISAAVDECFACAEGTRRALDAVGWVEPVEATTVEVDAREHHDALLRALLTRVEVEHDAAEDRKASTGDRKRARERMGRLAELMLWVKEASA
jgi:hypothetical protein